MSSLLQQALGLVAPWRVVDASFDADPRRLELRIDFERGATFACPDCDAAGCKAHDAETKTWRHLDFFQYQAFLTARVPRVRCPEHGVRLVAVPWARPESGHPVSGDRGNSCAVAGKLDGEPYRIETTDDPRHVYLTASDGSIAASTDADLKAGVRALTARAPIAGAVVTALLLCPVAVADTPFELRNRVLDVHNEDAGIKNQMTVTQSGSTVRFSDESDPFGMRGAQPTPCTATRFNDQGNATQYDCDGTRFDGISMDLGPAEDKLTYSANKPISVSGNTGADELHTGALEDFLTGDAGNDVLDGAAGNDELQGNDGDDTLTGAAGNDKLTGGPGADRMDGGDGDDTILAGDRTKDTIACGAGNDTVKAETIDEVAPDCENVERTAVSGPVNQAVGDDKRAPRCAAGGSTSQRMTARRRRIYVAVTSSEIGIVRASGFLDVAGLNRVIRAKPAKINVAGGGVEIAFTLTRGTHRLALRDLAKGRRVTARIKVVAEDRAGNTSRPVSLRIALRR